MYVCTGKSILYIGFSTICGFRYLQGSWNLSFVDKGGLPYCQTYSKQSINIYQMIELAKWLSNETNIKKANIL